MRTLHYVLSEKIFSVTGRIQQDFPGLYEHLNETPYSLKNYNKIEIEDIDLMHYLEELIFQMNFYKKQNIVGSSMKNLDTTSEAISKNWVEQKEKLLKKYSILNETDLLFIDGKKEIMLEKVRLTLRITKEELSQILSEF
ncbi:MAG TPA: hypothetical protein VJL37_04675 [Flavobacterium sp.]|nr:hypothetical protein [Flavobacterium sp.]